MSYKIIFKIECNINMTITFTSCFYVMPCKHILELYVKWINNFISIVNNINLVIYTNLESSKYIDTKGNARIKIIIRPIHEFYNYKYKEHWIKNHKKNHLLNNRICWEVNMLWSEKINFVKETMEQAYFDTEYYGWCDIGYFRNRVNDTNLERLKQWGNIHPLITNDKISYGCVCNDDTYTAKLFNIVNTKNELQLPMRPIPPDQVSIAGNCFVSHKSNIEWLFQKYDSTLNRYFENDYLVKDDQIILVDCILSSLDKFTLFKESSKEYDNWFMFQRILK
jgi:hypothetical protein